LYRIRLFLAVLLTLTTTSFASVPHYDLVFDLDRTLFYSLDQATGDPRDLAYVEGWNYKIALGVRELLTTLSKRDDVTISFFSGALESRNIELLKAFNLLDLANGRVYSKQHLTQILVSDDYTHKFEDIFRKDLRIINPDLNNILLIDDKKMMSYFDQENNVAWLDKPYDYFESFEKAANCGSRCTRLVPPTKAEFELEQAKLLWMFEMVDQALKRARKEKISLVQAYQKVFVPRESPAAISYLFSAVKKLKLPIRTYFIDNAPCGLLLENILKS